ncbi:fimbrial biogenesis chaperone [Pseudomonas helleri]|nr:molecular chaperone [Pseudomonas helleri]
MKVFYRPANLPVPPEKMATLLTFSLKQHAGGWVLVCHNPTPYHASFSSLSVMDEGRERAHAKTLDMMTPPLSDKPYSLASFSLDVQGKLTVNYTLIDDEGHYHDASTTVKIP